MSLVPLKQRVKILEEEVARLKECLMDVGKSKDWMEKVWGAFAKDPAFKEAMRLGREWRKSFRAKSRKKRTAGK